MPKVPRLEVIQVGRRWALEEKRRIVVESPERRRQVSATARRKTDQQKLGQDQRVLPVPGDL